MNPMPTALVAGLLVAFALAAPASATATTAAVHADAPAEAQVVCPPLPFPLNVVCGVLSDLCDKTHLCE